MMLYHKASDDKLYVSAIFDCYDLAVLGPAMDTNMKAALCKQTLDNACEAYPMLRGAVLHSGRGTQYTSELYRKAISKYGKIQRRITLWTLRYYFNDSGTVENAHLEIFHQLLE